MYKAFDRWLWPYLTRSRAKAPPLSRTHLILCVCDHFEPFHDVGKAEALRRVEQWGREFPPLAGGFADSSGSPPKHTFFYPIEQYDTDVIALLAQLCASTRCEAEVHLHHDADNAANLRRTLEEGRDRLHAHGLLARDASGSVRYGFIHGNWALAHSHPDGRHCGVPEELEILSETGCYADFTLPSAPSPTQTRMINSVYYAKGGGAPKPHDTGRLARVNQKDVEGLLLIQGPLGLNWRWRKCGVLPRIETGDLTGANPPTLARLRLWLDLRVHVQGKPEWVFAKLHTHGGVPANSRMLLGEPMKRFHGELARFASGTGLRFHYVTTREMVNIVHAAEDGAAGTPADFLDYRYRRRAA